MNDSSTSGAITSSFENISDVFTAHSEIAAGGFNCLYKAQRYGKWYVLKGLKPEFRNSTVHQELLAKEFELGIKMNHPHIAQTVGLDTDPLAGPCIVMEYVDGVTLKEFLQTNPSAKTRLKIAHELLSAIAYFHGLQIVHRDLKPDNILITRNGHNVKLIDFGLADSDYHGVLKQPAGSDRYAAPEQKEGKVAIDCRADIYAFGHILRQLFPHCYGAIYRKCVQPDRNKRYNNAEEILKRLQRVQWSTLALFLSMLLLCAGTTIWLLQKHYLQRHSPHAEPIILTNTDTLIVRDTVLIVTEPAAPPRIPQEAIRMLNRSLDTLFQPIWDKYHAATTPANLTQCTQDIQKILQKYDAIQHSILSPIKKAYPTCVPLSEQLDKAYHQNYNQRYKAICDSITRRFHLQNGLPDPFE
ncbi:MAG: serine/threonine protein kinase [Bacteroidales bacterium]|nr:serine/threonine protein kinase [Bacteroidales bacterium]